MDDKGIEVRFPPGQEIFLFSAASRPAEGLILRILSAGVKLLRNEADYSHPMSRFI
jgi:hypothetical protein